MWDHNLILSGYTVPKFQGCILIFDRLTARFLGHVFSWPPGTVIWPSLRLMVCFVFFKSKNMKYNSFNVIDYLNDLCSVLDRNKCFVVSLIYLWASFSALVDKHHSVLFCTFPFFLSHHLLQQIRLIRDLMVFLIFCWEWSVCVW